MNTLENQFAQMVSTQMDWEFTDTLLPQPEVAGGGWQFPK